MIYLNTAATSLHRPECVARAVAQAMNGLGNSGRGASGEDLEASRFIFRTREAVAQLMGFGHPDHVCFTSNATQAMNTALFGILSPGDTVICTDWDHNCILRPLHVMAQDPGPWRAPDAQTADKAGIKVCMWKSNALGRLDGADLKAILDREQNVKALVCTHASNLTGNVLDLKAVSDILRGHRQRTRHVGMGEMDAQSMDMGARHAGRGENHALDAERRGTDARAGEAARAPLFIVDAAQSAGTLPINMDENGIDVLVFTGHKSLMGPQGTGGLCVRPGVQIRPLISGGTGVRSYEPFQPEEYPAHLEAGTLNGHGLAGLKSALEWIEETGINTIHEKEMKLAWRFIRQIQDIPGIHLYGDLDAPVRTAIVSMNIADVPSDEVADALSVQYGIAVRAGAHCAPEMHRSIGTEKQGAVRFSMGWFNTEEEIDTAAVALREIAAL